MAMSQEHIRAVDQLRQRLSQLSASLLSLHAELDRNDPLPTWPSLQSTAQALSFNLQQLSETFQTHRQFFKEAHAYPLPTFPGLSLEPLLNELLRKKLDPGAENWIEAHTVKFDEGEGGGAGANGMSKEELRELWNWAAPASNGIVRPMLEEDGAFEDDFTIAEREAGLEKVVTGLTRRLDGQDDEDEGDDLEADAMDDVMPAAPKASGVGE